MTVGKPLLTIRDMDDLSDADTTTTTPTRDDVLKWNGTNWVPAVYSDTFEFTIASFTDNESATIEIGSGTWKSASSITFDMTYNNGPPDSGFITVGGTGGVSWSSGTLNLTVPMTTQDTVDDTAYPGDKDQTIVFTLDTTAGSDNDTDTETATFRNQIRWGKSSVSTGWTSAQIVALSGSVLSNDHTRNSMSITGVGASDYLIFACPASYSNLSDLNFNYNGLCINMEAAETISVTNDSGFTENYEVYRSNLQNLGDATLRSDQSNAANYILYGGSTTATGFTEGDVEGLTDLQNPISNDTTQTFNTVTLGASEYFVFAYPSRLTDPSNWFDDDTGFGLALYSGSPETVSITNVNGYTENYDVWRSENILGPGNFTLRTT